MTADQTHVQEEEHVLMESIVLHAIVNEDFMDEDVKRVRIVKFDYYQKFKETLIILIYLIVLLIIRVLKVTN